MKPGYGRQLIRVSLPPLNPFSSGDTNCYVKFNFDAKITTDRATESMSWVTIQSIHFKLRILVLPASLPRPNTLNQSRSSTSRKPVPLTDGPGHDILDGTQ